MNPKVSIITVVYNGEKFIKKSIESVLNQTYKNIEYIIIDGQSKDQTLNIVKSYKDNIDLIISEPDDGLYDAMNKGIRHATGDIIGMINSDDYYNSSTVELIVSQYKIYGNSYIYHGDMYIIDENDKIVEELNSIPLSKYFMKNGCSIAHPTSFIPKKLYIEFGLYDNNFNIVADYDLLLRFVLKNKVPHCHIDKKLAYFREGGISTDVLKTALQAHKARIRNGINKSESFVYYYRVKSFFYLKYILSFIGLERPIVYIYRKFISNNHRIK